MKKLREYSDIDGVKEWYLNGELHRDDGPAVIDEDSETWYQNGTIHREDGPAYISKTRERDGLSMIEKETLGVMKMLERNIPSISYKVDRWIQLLKQL